VGHVLQRSVGVYRVLLARLRPRGKLAKHATATISAGRRRSAQPHFDIGLEAGPHYDLQRFASRCPGLHRQLAPLLIGQRRSKSTLFHDVPLAIDPMQSVKNGSFRVCN